ncbi:PE-PGRS family protein [Dyadobacter sp. 32]|uniref:PE-PGRS family protein n=1 Tax=Dyadobacter sp. 32 TaxID=538966 RepID=UPI0011EBF27E
MNLNNVGKWIGGQMFFVGLLFSWSCDPAPEPVAGGAGSFESSPQSVSIAPGIIDEASGLAVSANLDGYLWTIQDSGQPHAVYLISPDGKNIKPYDVPGSINHDWEDLAVGPGPLSGVNYLYIADIGNNNPPMRAENVIYRFREIADANGAFKQTDLEKIIFRYPDGPRDAETILVDPQSRDIFIISKETDKSGIYRLPFPQSTTETINAERIGNVPLVTVATGGNVSVDGNEILLRTYLSVYYWQKKEGETIGQTLLKPATKKLDVVMEPQGEAVSFDRAAKGFYTLSEKGSAAGVSLNYYKRK